MRSTTPTIRSTNPKIPTYGFITPPPIKRPNPISTRTKPKMEEPIPFSICKNISIDNNKASELLKPITCMRCKTKNDPTVQFCFKCYYPLSEEAINNVEVVKEVIAGILAEAWKHPNPKEALPIVIEKFKKTQD